MKKTTITFCIMTGLSFAHMTAAPSETTENLSSERIKTPSMTVESDFIEMGQFDDAKWNWAGESFIVANKNDCLQITKQSERDRDRRDSRCETDMGVFGGSNHGEWGGKLYTMDKDGTKTVIKKGNIISIFKMDDGDVYFLEGLNHLGFSEGAFYRIEKTDSGVRCALLCKFENDSPEAYLKHNGKLLIVFNRKISTVDLSGKEEVLFSDLPFGILYPTSITVFGDHTFYVGTRGGIFKLDLQPKKITPYEYRLLKDNRPSY